MCQCPISGSLHFYIQRNSTATQYRLCQCPISGSLHFYSSALLTPPPASAVSMPYLGLPSFLRCSGRMQIMSIPCVNALSRAPFISTLALMHCPKSLKWCQCPISGSLHFYREKEDCMFKTKYVSMPYLGLPSFLQKSNQLSKPCRTMCQCPISGSLHFYRS